jgi:hypothetical protein
MYQLLPYPFKVWITSVLAGSTLHVIWIKLFEASSHTVLNGIYPLVFILAVICSGLLSVPAFLLLWFASWVLVKRSFTKLATKSILIMLSSILAFITIRMISGVDEVKFWSSDNLDVLLCYWVVLVAGIIFYKLDSPLQRVRRGIEK